MIEREDFLRIAGNFGVPELTAETLADYLYEGLQPGGFVTGVLSNDLVEACLRADDENLAALRETVRFVYNAMPSQAWGSAARIREHLRKVAA